MAVSWIKTPAEIECLRESGKRLARVTEKLIEYIRPGISTGEIGNLADAFIKTEGGQAIFKGYGKAWGAPPFPAAVCLSLNEEVVHGIPREDRILQEGDLLKIDIGMRYQGMVTDMARTVAVGSVSPAAHTLMEVTQASLMAGITILEPRKSMEEYASVVEKTVEQAGFSCVRDLVGHGVGHELHEDPQIPNYTGSKLPPFVFQAGMTVALEPMVNIGGADVKLADDGWTFITADGSLSAHFEDTVLITSSGSEVLTRI